MYGAFMGGLTGLFVNAMHQYEWPSGDPFPNFRRSDSVTWLVCHLMVRLIFYRSVILYHILVTTPGGVNNQQLLTFLIL